MYNLELGLVFHTAPVRLSVHRGEGVRYRYSTLVYRATSCVFPVTVTPHVDHSFVTRNSRLNKIKILSKKNGSKKKEAILEPVSDYGD